MADLRRYRRGAMQALAIFSLCIFVYQCFELSSHNFALSNRLQDDLPRYSALDGDTSRNKILLRGLSFDTEDSDLAIIDKDERDNRLGASKIHRSVFTNISNNLLEEDSRSSPCPVSPKSQVKAKDQVWQMVIPGQTYVFSAFIDRRMRRRDVRVVGMTNTRKGKKPIFCQVWYENRTLPVIVAIQDDIVPETHDRRFAVFLYTCSLASMDNLRPIAVSLVEERCQHAKNKVLISTKRLAPKARPSFTVCVSALYNNFNDADRLVDFIESHRLMGVSKFVFYNMSLGAEVGKYLEFYKQTGLVDILPWHVPKHVDAHYHAQLATLNDCLYRYMHRSRYIAFLDVDEILVPTIHGSWHNLMRNLEKIPHSSKICAFVFQCVFFRLDWPDDPTYLKDITDMRHVSYSLQKTKREEEAYPHFHRSKLIVNPRKVDLIGIHFIHKPLSDHMMYDVSNTTASLHHYRRWGDNTINAWVVDRTMFHYAKDLLRQMQAVHKQMQPQIANLTSKGT